MFHESWCSSTWNVRKTLNHLILDGYLGQLTCTHTNTYTPEIMLENRWNYIIRCSSLTISCWHHGAAYHIFALDDFLSACVVWKFEEKNSHWKSITANFHSNRWTVWIMICNFATYTQHINPIFIHRLHFISDKLSTIDSSKFLCM